MNDKQTGSFYTPEPLVQYMSSYAMEKTNAQSLLEPSAGDGRFIRWLNHYGRPIDAVEIDQGKINDLSTDMPQNVKLICNDFIQYSLTSNKKYDLIIGNPPYITKKNLSENERATSIELVKYWSLPESVFQNLWVSFVLGALKLLDSENGAIFFVLPFEFLQVHYAEKLRAFLERKFNLIEITTFKESVFPDIEQDVCLVFMTNQQELEPIVRYTTVENVNEIYPVEYSEIRRNKPLKKWSNSILNDDEIELLTRLTKKYTLVSNLGDISPGIVTGANEFFILNNSDAELLNCREYLLPIIPKGSNVANLLLFSKDDFNELNELNKKVWMLNLNDVDISKVSRTLKAYLAKGKRDELHKRYKCGKRDRWHDVPIVSSGNLMFYKRYNRLPRLIVNNAEVFTTDISYNIRLSEGYDSLSVAFCFYNSLTITLCEYNGRFYGGGVGELVPSEFKSLAIPYKRIHKNRVKKLDRMFRDNISIQDILTYVDSIVLSDLSITELNALKIIREKYLIRRLKSQY
ncbi:Eco57I restriction-modification methylase domain-containing protein [Cohnella xylanilytica]|uniref:site-specific DNA-methyltransferase (adenine-specific) n=1 Tax=Cohnella xylanilytica TaxID=557555 RepID=A0A841U193_9BACL|nr:Eco57I restriction-modification methylase domain-containing protein [Cohnella xylanilytica]MBB6693559.1 Eco57I restriction-modification methylase domain-containing protein [Cohnella xylanilytica]